MKSTVAILRTTPQTILADYQRLFELSGASRVMDNRLTTILKDNITWHFPMPGANTTPWQLEGSILALRKAGFNDLVCVQNQTVVTNAFKGEDLKRLCPDLSTLQSAGALQFPQGRYAMGGIQTQSQNAGPGPYLPGRHSHPGFLYRQEYCPLTHGQNPHVHHHHRGNEECFWWTAQQIPPLHPHLDPRNPGGPAGHPEGNSPRYILQSWMARQRVMALARG